MLNNKLINKKAQVGETTTWIVATIVLILILLVFTFVSVALSKTKHYNSDIKANSAESTDWIKLKSQLAYSINSENKNRIEMWLSKEGVYEEE